MFYFSSFLFLIFNSRFLNFPGCYVVPTFLGEGVLGGKLLADFGIALDVSLRLETVILETESPFRFLDGVEGRSFFFEAAWSLILGSVPDLGFPDLEDPSGTLWECLVKGRRLLEGMGVLLLNFLHLF